MPDDPKRGEDEILAATLPVSIHGEVREVRVLVIAEAREWKRKLLGAVVGGIGTMSLENLSDGGNVVETFGNRILELVVAYDLDAKLGGREYLEGHATDGEVYAAFRSMLRISFPFAKDLRTAVAELRALGLADLLAVAARPPEADDGSPSGSSTLGRSESGDSVLVASTSS